MSSQESGPPNRRSWWQRLQAGGWYFLVAIASVGILSAIPFWHAARRLARPTLRPLAIAYTVAGLVVLLLAAVVPRDEQGNATGTLGHTLESLYVIAGLTVVVAACVQLRPLRREVFPPQQRAPILVDPAVARVLAGRARRDEARRLWAQDSAMGRELGIGRPDLSRGYDDGGLVDVNTAPAAVIAAVCGLETEQAEQIVAARARCSGYFNLGELFVDVHLPDSAQEQLKERAIT